MASEDAALQTILQDPTFAAFSPEKKQKVLQALQGLSPAQRQQFADGLARQRPDALPSMEDRTPLEGNMTNDVGTSASEGTARDPERRNAPKQFFTKDVPAMALDATGQIAGGAAGAYIGAPLLGAGAGGYLANQANKALGLREGTPFTSFTTEDALNTALPVAAGIATGIGRTTAKPAREAMQTYEQEKQIAIGEGNTALRSADIAAKDTNASRIQQYREAVQAETDRFLKARDDLQARTGLSNAQRQQQYKDLVRDYRQALDDHRQAFQTVPAEGRRGVVVDSPRKHYEASHNAAQRAEIVETTPLQEQAERLGVSMRQPADPFQNPFRRVTDALQTWGAPEEAGEAVSPILDSAGRPIKSLIGGSEGGVPLERAIATHQKLGQVIGATEERGGEQWGAAKKLYTTLSDMLEEQAAKDPQAAKAIQEYLAGQRAWRRQQALLDWDELFKVGHHGNQVIAPQTVKLNSTGIRTAFEKLVEDDKFFAGSFSDVELKGMRRALEKLPGKIPAEPPANAPTPLNVDYTKLRPIQSVAQPELAQPDYSKAVSPVPAQPDAGRFPFGRAILGRIAGSNAGAVAAGQQGSNQAMGWVGFAVAALPHWVSKTLLAHPQGRQITQNIIAGKRAIGPKEVAALTAVARTLGGQPEENQ